MIVGFISSSSAHTSISTLPRAVANVFSARRADLLLSESAPRDLLDLARSQLHYPRLVPTLACPDSRFSVHCVAHLHSNEPFPSWLCFAELQYVGALGELTGAPGGWKVPAHPKLGLATAGVS